MDMPAAVRWQSTSANYYSNRESYPVYYFLTDDWPRSVCTLDPEGGDKREEELAGD